VKGHTAAEIDMKKRAKAGSKKQARSKAKVSAKAKSTAKSSAKKATSKRKTATKRARRERPAVQGSQSVETVQVKRRAMRARAGAGGGDFGGVSVVESVDSESADELLEEGQTFEAGIVSGVEDAPDADQGPVRTHEVPQDDVPEEYDDKDRP
jgi:hypothetical protein